MKTAVTFIATYIIGSIPIAYIYGKYLAGIDIRDHGSGNIGAMNMQEALGWGAGLAVMTMDALKGAIAVIIAAGLGCPLWLGAAAAVLGHIYPVWLRFEGGKGLATAGGSLITATLMNQGFLLTVVLVFAIIWILFYAYFRDIDLANLAASLAAAVLSLLYEPIFCWSTLWLVIIAKHLHVLISGRHRSNV